MFTSYFDSSALVKRYMTETGTLWVQTTCADSDQTIAIAEIGLVEIAAAFSGKHRGGFINGSLYLQALADLHYDSLHDYVLVSVDRTIVDEAITLTTRYRLRGYDAVHLACALRLNRSLVTCQLMPLTFICADNDLSQAAQSEGLVVDNPNLHP